MMYRSHNRALTLILGFMTVSCGDHDRLIGRERDAEAGNSGSGGAAGGDGSQTGGRGGRGAGGTKNGIGGSTSSTGGTTHATMSAAGGNAGNSSSAGGTVSGGGAGGTTAIGGTSAIGGMVVGPCDYVACGSHGRCVTTAENAAECVCNSGYVLKGGQCLSELPLTDVAAGDSFACALRSDGTVSCWGQNLDYALGDGVLETNESRGAPAPVSGIEHAIAISARDHAACAVESDHTVKCWGFVAGRTLKTATRIEGMANATGVAASAGTVCALTDSGEAYCSGLIGTMFVTSPCLVTENVDPVRSVYANNGVVCVLLSTGDMHCVPESSTQLSSTPTLQKVATLGAHNDRECAPLVVMQDGSVNVPDAPTTYPYDYQIADGYEDIIGVVGKTAFMCGIRTNGDVTCSGSNSDGQLCTGAITNGVETPKQALGLTRITKLATGFHFGCALNEAGNVRCWGRAVEGELGDDARPSRSVPYEVEGPSGVTDVCVSLDSTCALDDGSVLRCWGRDHSNGSPVPWLSEVAQCDTGDNFCAVMKDGTLKCWGFVPMGDGTTVVRKSPTDVPGLTDVVSVAVGSLIGNLMHSCAVRRDGTVRCWGSNGYGQLGDGTTIERLAPVAVAGLTDAVTVEVGPYHSCSVLRDGQVRCWGDNQNGELGNGTTSAVSGLVSPLGLQGIQQLKIVGASTYAVDAVGTVFKWGGSVSVAGSSDETDPPVVTYDPTPHRWNGPAGVAEVVSDSMVRLRSGLVLVKTSGTWSIAPGFGETKVVDRHGHACAVLTSGKVRCAGSAYYGQLGDGYTTARPWAELVSAW